MIIEVKIPLYRNSIIFYVDESDESATKHYKKVTGNRRVENDFIKLPPHSDAATYLEENGLSFIIMDSRLSNGILYHEIFHAVSHLLRFVGMSLTPESEEAYAYLIGYVTDKFYEKFKLFLAD